MSLASDYLTYAERIADHLRDPNPKTFEAARLQAYLVQNSYYGVSIDPPKLHDNLQARVDLLLQGNESEWRKLLSPLKRVVPHSFPSYSSSEPVYHRLDSIRQRLSA